MKNIIDLAIVILGLSLIALVYLLFIESRSPAPELPRMYTAPPLPKVHGPPVPTKQQVFSTPSQQETAAISNHSITTAGEISHKTPGPAPAPILAKEKEEDLIDKFINWGEEHDIELVGVNKSVDDFYYGVTTKEDFLPIDNIPNLLEVAKGLYSIPEPLLAAMKGKTLYLSHQRGRGYTVLGSWPGKNILRNVNRGTIIEQPLSRLQTIHEFAHILDFHGIQGLYEDENNHWKWLKEMSGDTFAVAFTYDPNLPKPPAGYMDVYSTANSAENFAQHFTFYILRGKEFRERAKGDRLLQEKYDFFYQYLFEGREY